MSGRCRFLSVDNLDDSKTDFGIKVDQLYDRSEQPEMVTNTEFYHLGLSKIEECNLSISAIPENQNKTAVEEKSALEISSTSSEKSYE